MESEYTINAYEKNQVMLYAVQGECESRTVIFSIIEKSGIVIPTSNASVTNQMLDLTDYTAELQAVYNGQIIAVCTGETVNAQGGILQFTLTADFMSISGKLNCIMILEKNNTNLRIVGITLDVQSVGTESSFVMQAYRNHLNSFLIQLRNNGSPYTLGNGESLVFTLKDGETAIIQKTLTNSDYDENENGYILSLTSSQMNISTGTYSYYIDLCRSGSEPETVIPKSQFIVMEG